MPVLSTLAVALLLQAGAPVLIGLDLEFGHKSSTSAVAVQRGVELAVSEINAAGGVLGGRPLEIVALDNRSVTARGLDNVRTLAAKKDLVAYFCGKFSPTALEQVALLHELKLPLLDPWAAADAIVEHGRKPSYTFRLSATDRWAMARLLRSAQERGFSRVALILNNTGWGRSAEAAANAWVAANGGATRIVATRWFNWGVRTLAPDYEAARAAGAQAILIVANEVEGGLLLREIAALPAEQRLPVLAHHGIVGGDLVGLTGNALHHLDFSVVQFFVASAARPRGQRLVATLRDRYGIPDAAHALSVAGTAAAYDLTRLLATAIDLAGTTDRAAVRDALERLPPYDGAVKRLERPFTPTRHEALTPEDLFIARFDGGGALVRSP